MHFLYKLTFTTDQRVSYFILQSNMIKKRPFKEEYKWSFLNRWSWLAG